MSESAWEPADWVNPVAIKEIRQALRGRTFGIAFGLLLTACVVLSLVAWSVDTDSAQNMAALPMDGKTIFWAVGALLGLSSCLGIPAAAARAFALERSEDTRWIISLTPLTARQILRGKIASALVQGGLIFCAGAPFLLFGYFLQNVSFVDILELLAVLIIAQLFFATLLISLSAFVGTGQVRRMNPFNAIFGIAAVFIINIGFTFTRFLGGGSPAVLANWPVYTAAVATLLSFAFLAFELGSGKLALPTMNTTGGPRLALILHLAFVLFWPYHARSSTSTVAPFIALIYGSVVIGLMGVSGLITADAPSHGLRDRSRASWILLPGSLNGWHFGAVALVAWSAVVHATGHAPKGDTGSIYLTVPCLGLFYLGLAALGRDRVRQPSEQVTLTLTLLLLAILVFTVAAEGVGVLQGDQASAFHWRLLSLVLPLTISNLGSAEATELATQGVLFQLVIAGLVALFAEVRLRARELAALAIH